MMPSQESFRAFYDATLLPVLQDLEAERKMLIRKFLLYTAIGLALAVLLFMYVAPLAGIAPLILAYIVYYAQFGQIIREKKVRFKREVIGKTVTFLHRDLLYDHARCIDKNTYHRSKLYLDNINRFNGDDLVNGTVGKTAIQFCELHTQEVRRSDKNTTVVTIFRGLFFIADFNKKFVGETFVLSDTAESTFGSLGTFFQKMNMSRPALVKLEDVEFEKAFAVYSTDQVEARYILSPALMQRITGFRNKTRRKISMSFIDSNVFIGIPVSKNLFEASTFSTLVNYSRIAEYYNYLALCIGIVEDLDLNTRIWTKE